MSTIDEGAGVCDGASTTLSDDSHSAVITVPSLGIAVSLRDLARWRDVFAAAERWATARRDEALARRELAEWWAIDKPTEPPPTLAWHAAMAALQRAAAELTGMFPMACTCICHREATHLEPAEWEQDEFCPVHP